MTLDLAHLLDFEALADTGSFSRAATLRNVTQPAFSRRIRALEAWAGAPLFHRGATPVTLTEAGAAIAPALAQARHQLTRGQAAAQAAAARTTAALHFAATHVLSFTFFPQWLRGREGGPPLEAVRLSSDSLSACERLIGEGRVQFLLCHHHPAAPVRLDEARFSSLRVGADRLVPVAVPDAAGRPRFALGDEPDDAGSRPMPLLGYSEESGLGRILAAALPAPLVLRVGAAVFRSHLAAALRGMALTGRGLAWLPESLVDEDLASGRLVRAGGPALDVAVGIHLFRPAQDLGAAAERFWDDVARGVPRLPQA